MVSTTARACCLLALCILPVCEGSLATRSRRLLWTTGGDGASAAGRHLLQGAGGGNAGPRKFESVDAHKQPRAPVITRSSFARQYPLTALASSAEGGRHLLQGTAGGGNLGPRTFESVDAHKEPRQPVLTRKSFDTSFAVGGAAGAADAGRRLL